MDLVGGLVTDVCYRNIRRYLDLANGGSHVKSPSSVANFDCGVMQLRIC